MTNKDEGEMMWWLCDSNSLQTSAAF